MQNVRKTRWADLFPQEFLERQAQLPLVYLPLGICEPHGYISTLGLDTYKADYLCDEAANRFGGIVAPTLGYQIHEAGYHAPWLAEVLGEQNAMMTSMPPHVMLYFFLYQLRSFYNAGFSTALVITGHSGGNQQDFRLAGEIFESHSQMKVFVFSDPELVTGMYKGDHAGKYEISQSLYLRPDTIDLSAIDKMHEANSLGRFAQGTDAGEANAATGKDIIEKSLTYIGQIVEQSMHRQNLPTESMNYAQVENMYKELTQRKSEWCTLRTKPEQTLAPFGSKWKKFETIDLASSTI